MNLLAQIGKRRMILLSISILLVSLHTIYYYHSVRPEIETKKLVQQIIRFALTVGLLVMIYKGKKWAKSLGIVLFSIAALISIVSVFFIDTSIVNKTPLIVMTVVYSVAVYFLTYSKAFKEFYEHQNS